MRKLFLAAAGLFIAASAQADTPPAAAPVVPATPVVTTGEYVTAAPARRGLFARFRSRMTRNTTTLGYAPVTTTATPAAPVTLTPTPTPMPMGKVSSVTPESGIVQTSGTTMTPMTVTNGTVLPASYVMPSSVTSTTRPLMRLGMFRTMRYNR